jgi:hypothetical protein
MTHALFANIVWHSLAGAHAPYSCGTGSARRYARGFSPIMGFANPERPDLSAMEPFCDVGEQVYCAGWSGPVPSGWQIEVHNVAHQMVWDGESPGIFEYRIACCESGRVLNLTPL